MALLTKFTLLFLVCLTSAAFDLAVATTSEPRHFFVQKSSCLPCPSGWDIHARRCFKYVTQGMAWVSAEAHCLSLGANLVSIHNDNEYQFVKTLIQRESQMENPTWIGLSDCQEQKYWIWSDGSNLTFTKWNANEPNFSKGECCVHINWAEEKNWNDIPCSLKYPFVCVKTLTGN